MITALSSLIDVYATTTNIAWRISCETFGSASDWDDHPDLHAMADRFDAHTYHEKDRCVLSAHR